MHLFSKIFNKFLHSSRLNIFLKYPIGCSFVIIVYANSAYASQNDLNIWLSCKMKISGQREGFSIKEEGTILFNVIDRKNPIYTVHIIPERGYLETLPIPPISNLARKSTEYESNSVVNLSNDDRWELNSSGINKITNEITEVSYLIHRSAGTISYSMKVINFSKPPLLFTGVGNCEKVDNSKKKF